MNKLELTLEQAEQILNYLGTKPYKEVYGLIQMMQSLYSQQSKKESEQK